MQKVQRWSQPFCTLQESAGLIFESGPSNPSTIWMAVSLHAHNVVDPYALKREVGPLDIQPGIAFGFEFFFIAQHLVHFRHCGIQGPGLDLGGAAGDDDARPRPLAAQPADRLARLAHSFIRSPRRY